MFLEYSENLTNGFHMTLINIFGVNRIVIELYDSKNIKFFCQNFFDITLKADEVVAKSKRHDLVLEIAVPHLECCFPLITHLNSHQ